MPTIEGTEGPDVLNGTEDDDDIFGLGGNDFIFGNGGNDRLHGGEGNDFIDGGAGDDLVDGGDGGGTLRGGAGNDQLIGGTGSDVMAGGAGDDILDSGDFLDNLRGEGGNDQLFAGANNDFLAGGLGDDLIDGGSGWDRASYANDANGSGVTVNLSLQGVAQNTGVQGWDTLVGIEYVSATVFNDILIGDDGANWLWGGTAVTPGVANGDDAVYGGGGNDIIDVHTGHDTVDGGTGIDTLSLWGNASVDVTSAGVTVSLLLQGLEQDTEQGFINMVGIENLTGTRYADVLTGDAGDNVLAGASGSDALSGGEGHDTLLGDGWITATFGEPFTFVDILSPLPTQIAGNDILDGGEGHDRLIGARGDDVLTGGGGHDTFVYLAANNGQDVITDFQKIDSIDLSAIASLDSYDELVITEADGDVTISWGTSEQITLADFQLKHLSADNFIF